jgi:hypothetical protein
MSVKLNEFQTATTISPNDHIVGYSVASADGERRWTFQSLLNSTTETAQSPVLKTASFSITNKDHNKVFLANSTSTIIVTLPANINSGTDISVIRANTGAVNFAAGAGATVKSAPDSTFVKLGFENSIAGAICTGNNTWYLFGDLIP